jgi:hypothetical protein
MWSCVTFSPAMHNSMVYRDALVRCCSYGNAQGLIRLLSLMCIEWTTEHPNPLSSSHVTQDNAPQHSLALPAALPCQYFCMCTTNTFIENKIKICLESPPLCASFEHLSKDLWWVLRSEKSCMHRKSRDSKQMHAIAGFPRNLQVLCAGAGMSMRIGPKWWASQQDSHATALHQWDNKQEALVEERRICCGTRIWAGTRQSTWAKYDNGSNQYLDNCTPSASKPTIETHKQDEDHKDWEDRHLKRILQLQENYGLLGHQDITLKAAEHLTVAALSNKYQLPKFLDYYKASPYHVANPMTDSTLVKIWQSIRVQEPQRWFHPKSIWHHAHAQPPHQKKTAIADLVLYTRDASMLNMAHAQIHGMPDLKLQLAHHETDLLKKIVMLLGFG